MTDIPIIFSAPMIQALIAGRKTMTRRLAWRPARAREASEIGLGPVFVKTPWQRVKPGDRLYVRENFARNANQLSDTFMDTSIVYAADGKGRALDNGTEKPWTPCIHMPRHASRLTLIVTASKVERLQDISEDDAWAEGVCSFVESTDRPGSWAGLTDNDRRKLVRINFGSARKAFNCLFDQLHGPAVWNSNPEVVALTFRVVNANIDAPEAMAA